MSDGKLPVDLDALLSRAMARQTPKAPRRKAGDTVTPEEMAAAEKRIRERWTLPENWETKRHVTLIHKESQTVLGNFAELKHRFIQGCRRLVRVEGPTPVDAIEEVEGDNWHAPRPEPEHKLPREALRDEEREVVTNLHLPELNNVFAAGVLVTVHLQWGGVAKVVLFDETRFYSKDRRVQLLLPEGVDVLEVMSFDSKLELRKELGL